MPRREDSWKCVCGTRVLSDEEDNVVELDGVLHSCDDEDEDDF